MTQGSNKLLLIGIGIVLGLLLATTLYLFFENREIKEVLENQKNNVETADEDENYKKADSRKDIKTLKDEAFPDDQSSETVISEQGLWKATKKINSFDGYLEYMKSADEDGTHYQESISKLLEIGTSGWLYSGRTSGDGTYSKDQMLEVTWRKDNNNNPRRILPDKGDIVSLISKEGRRTYPDFLPRDKQNGIWQLNSNALVLEVRMEGKSAVILKVVYQ